MKIFFKQKGFTPLENSGKGSKKRTSGSLTGFTLLETMIALSIFALFIFMVSAMLNNIFVNSNQQLTSLDNIDYVRGTMSLFINEIRNAITGSDGSYPINEAGESQIIFFSNFKTSNGVIARIRYYVSDNTLYKGIVLPTGDPLSYNLSSESIKAVANGISNNGVPAFYYYDGDYDGNSDALSQPVNINQIRFVKMNLMVLKQLEPNNDSAFSITAGSAVRSIKDNLGN